MKRHPWLNLETLEALSPATLTHEPPGTPSRGDLTMPIKHNPRRCAELCRDARERSKPHPMEAFRGADDELIVELANQLEAAGREVARLTKLGNEVACALSVEGESDATVTHTAWEARGLIMAGVTTRTERDALRHERDNLRAKNEQLRAERTGARKTDAQRMDDALAAYKAAAPTGERDGSP